MAEPHASTFGEYHLLRRLGAGAMGDVFLARPLDVESPIPSPCVIKRLHNDLARSDLFLRRFAHEAKLAALVRSPYVARFYDAGTVDGIAYLTLEYVKGWTLAQVLDDRNSRQEHLPVGEAINIIDHALLGLDALHTVTDPHSGQPLNVVHRDVSPKNLMLGEDGRARVIDLGLGKSSLKEWKTRTGQLLGAPGYMAPEQVAASAVDHRTDLYGVAIVLFELLTMQFFVPRGSLAAMLEYSRTPKIPQPSVLRPELPGALDGVVQKGLQPDPAHRFQSAGEFREALHAAWEGMPAQERTVMHISSSLRDELSVRQRDIDELMSQGPPPFAPTAIRTLARAAGMETLDRLSEEEQLAPTRVREPEQADTRIVAPPPQPALSSPPPRQFSIATVLAIAASMLVVGILVDRYLLRSAGSDESAAPKTIVAPAPAKLTVTPRPRAPAEPTAQPPEPVPAAAASKEAKPKPKARSTRVPPSVTKVTGEARAPEGVTPQGLKARINTLKRQLPADSEHRKTLVKLGLTLLRESRAKDDAKRTERLMEIAAQIRRIEEVAKGL